ncbi:MAG: C-type lectin domain-containing protein [Chitinophagales bacterium]|nr:C-type lectin domain-containing protein [Chitinophagales bacterium]
MELYLNQEHAISVTDDETKKKWNYYIVTEPMWWAYAKAYAEIRNKRLATIPNLGLNVILALELERLNLNKAWIGLNRKSSKNSWQWVSGKPFDENKFSNWAFGEPNNHWGHENWVMMYKDGKWNDLWNFKEGDKIPFIMEDLW